MLRPSNIVCWGERSPDSSPDEPQQILAHLRLGLADLVVRLEQLYGGGEPAARSQEGPRDGESRWECPRQVELLTDRRHLVPGIEHVRHAVPRQYRAV